MLVLLRFNGMFIKDIGFGFVILEIGWFEKGLGMVFFISVCWFDVGRVGICFKELYCGYRGL